MGTLGRQAWDKHFADRGEVHTVLKKDAAGFARGQPLVVVPQNYTTSVSVQIEGQTVSVPFHAIAKPVRTSASLINLKPQELGVEERHYTTEELATCVRDAMQDKISDDKLRAYLVDLIDYVSLRKPREALEEHDTKKLPANFIEKDFGEVVGPIAIVNGLAQFANAIFSVEQNSTVFYPSSLSYQLTDYIINDGQEHLFSAKALGTSNTVKTKNIIELLHASGAEERWKGTQIYEVFRILSENSCVQGPIRAAFYLGNCGAAGFAEFFTGEPDDACMVASRQEHITDQLKLQLSRFISEKPQLLQTPTALAVNYEIERLLVEWSKKNQDQISKMFLDAVGERLRYIKFSGVANCNPQFTISSPSDFLTNGVALRSKSGYTRAQDKLGLQT